ncbi:MAG: class I lanthipeptide [Candidatus Aminicenantes bacterium]|nr:class I lanthipeptide [Candidatus Aminicenantes bacterium]
MKKKLTQKLLLNKNTISKLQDEESRALKGGTAIKDTSECNTDVKTSCSMVMVCCTLPEKAVNNG